MNRGEIFKKLSILCLTLSFSLTALVIPRKADAYLVAAILSDDYRMFNFNGSYPKNHGNAGSTFLCLLFLPICVLDSADQSVFRPLNSQSLLANGYTEAEVREILENQRLFYASFVQSGQRIMSSADPRENTAARFQRAAREVVPGISQLYLDVVSESMGR